MFLAKPSNWNGEPPLYLVTGDRVVWLQDVQSQTAFTRVGVPVVALSQPMFTELTTELAPHREYPLAVRPDDPQRPQFVPVTDAMIDGGDASTIYSGSVYDGGSSFTDEFDDAPANAA